MNGRDGQLHILHVIRGMANSSGTTHTVGPLAEAQARQGHVVRVYFVDKPGNQPTLPDSSLVESRGFPMTVPTEHAGWSLSIARALPSAIRQADVVHIHAIWNFPTLCAMRAAHGANVPYVVAPHGSLEQWALARSRHLKTLYASLVERPYFDRALAMQALTETEAEQCRRFGIKAPARILPNGVDLTVVDREGSRLDLRSQFSLPERSVVFLFLGRLFPKKGLDLLIPAFARLVNEGANAALLFAGVDGGSGYRDRMQQLAEAHGATSRMRFIGEISGPRKFDTLRAADVFVLSSYSEGLPVAALEAMACRRPVVLTRNCNLGDVGVREAGWLVEPRIEDVFEALRAAHGSAAERQRRGASARLLVEERYTWDRIASHSLNLYRPAAANAN